MKYGNEEKETDFRFEKQNFQKKLEKVLAVQKNALPLHPLSERKPLKKSSLKDLDISKQVVQVLSGR